MGQPSAAGRETASACARKTPWPALRRPHVAAAAAARDEASRAASDRAINFAQACPARRQSQPRGGGQEDSAEWRASARLFFAHSRRVGGLFDAIGDGARAAAIR